MQRFWPYILSAGLLVYLIIVLTFAGSQREGVPCRGIRVYVRDVEEVGFIDEGDVMAMVRRGYGDVRRMPVAEIDKDSVERLVAGSPAVETAEVFYSLDGYLHISVTQRRPVLRVVSEGGYYVDEEGRTMPLFRKYTARVVVATGEVSKRFACQRLYPFVMMLHDDEFWDALVEQIVVNGKGEVALIPKVGGFRIMLGTLENVERKMDNLRLFLKEGIGKKGWNLYKEVSLKFDNQVVCVRKQV